MTNTLTAEQALETLFLDSCHFHDGNLREDEYQTIRTALSPLPSPPVSGDVKPYMSGEDHLALARGYLSRQVHQNGNQITHLAGKTWVLNTDATEAIYSALSAAIGERG